MILTLKVLIQSITWQSDTTVHHAPLYQVQFQLLQWFVQPLLWPWPWKCQSSLFPWQSGTTKHHHTTFGSNSFCGLDSITQILPISLQTKHTFNSLKSFSNFIGFFSFLKLQSNWHGCCDQNHKYQCSFIYMSYTYSQWETKWSAEK